MKRFFIWFIASFVFTMIIAYSAAWYQLNQAVVIADTENMEAVWEKRK